MPFVVWIVALPVQIVETFYTRTPSEFKVELHLLKKHSRQIITTLEEQ